MSGSLSRRDFVRAGSVLGAAAALDALLPRYARGYSLPRAAPAREPGDAAAHAVAEYDLAVEEHSLSIAGRRTSAVTLNRTIPGPLLTFQEGGDAVIRVHNRLREDTSVHWHGLLVPPAMDGVPGVSFPGIRPGETFEYRFPVRQYGTYWYHSHSGLQEQLGHFGPLIIHPAGGYPYAFDREYIVMLSDWTFENPYRVLDRLKKQGNYYNFQRRTVGEFFRDVSRDGLMPTVRERLMWLRMRMDPTDLQDVTGATYTYLINGTAPGDNWTGLFAPGERVLLRFINAGAGSMFDVRIPDLPMTVVQASGQFVQPVETDELRITNAETFDVIVEPGDRPYTIFAESTDRSGFARGTLTPRAGWNAPIPPRRRRPLLTMADMGMAHGDMTAMPGMAPADAGAAMPGMDHSAMPGMTPATDTARSMSGMDHSAAGMTSGDRARYAVAGVSRTTGLRAPGTVPGMLDHEPGRHGVENGAVPMMVTSRLTEPGTGLGNDGWRVLLYSDLKAREPRQEFRAADREIEIHLTGNMERFMWSVNGRAFSPDMPPIRMNFGERVRLTMVNDTMMNHPMHLHGMWMELENGHLDRIPRVHTVNVKPAERVSVLITADAPGRWAFHCHILYHMESGMFRVFEVAEPNAPFPEEALQHVP
ncbi:MAG: copper resistance system multicopper oxidase [Gemmatimonadaceae bacterium]